MLRASVTAILSILLILHSHVSAQLSAPSCLPGADLWAFNSLNQSPCLVAAALGGACNNGAFSLVSLGGPDFYYLGTTKLGADNSCKCSTVYYSVLSACALCQNATWLDWTDYTQNCSSLYVENFQEPIPQGTKVPHYAYLNITDNNNFNPILAQSATGPESTPVSQATQSSAAATGTSTSSSAHNSKKLNVGAIAGGVVGGVALIIIAGLATCFLVMRRRKRFAASNQQYQSASALYNVGLPPNAMMNYSAGIPGSMESSGKPLYNPNDPSTFPSGAGYPGGFGYNTYAPLPDQNNQGSPPHIQQSLTGNTNTTLVSNPVPAPRTQYTGIPEL